MKKILITTMLGIATTAAFGAASLRTPQLGTATVTTPAATTNTARAGTMRTQTMKTSSVSSPASVTTTQSIATPVSTETTDARIALLKGIKGFNPGKIKDTATATSELNSLNDRIEELTAQLDRAEAAQSTVLTEDTIDAKIDEKLTALGTSSGTKDTYSKTEVDNLLNDIKRKLPTIDNRGNINLTSATGTTSVQLLPYYLYATHTHALLGHSMTYRLHTPHNFGTTNWISLAPEYTSNWVNDICAPYRSDPDFLACGFWSASGPSMTMTEFNVARCTSGFGLFWTNHVGGVESSRYVTYENMTESQIREHFCGTLTSDLCWISNYEIKPSMGDCTPKYFYVNMSNNIQPYYWIQTLLHDGGLVQDDVYGLTVPHDFGNTGWGNFPNGPAWQLTAEWVSEICSMTNPDNLISCGPGGLQGHGTILDIFNVIRCFEGFEQTSMHLTSTGVKYDYVTFENLTENQIRARFCDGMSNDACSISNYQENSWSSSCIEKTFTVNVSYSVTAGHNEEELSL